MPTTTTLEQLPGLIGQDLGYSDWISVGQERIDLFADATGDHQWIHVDAERAKGGPFGTTIAHGYLTLSLLLPAFTELLDVKGVTTKVNYGLNSVRFPSPVPAGAKIRVTGRVADVTEIKGGAQLVVDATAEAEGADKPACVAQPVLRFYA